MVHASKNVVVNDNTCNSGSNYYSKYTMVHVQPIYMCTFGKHGYELLLHEELAVLLTLAATFMGSQNHHDNNPLTFNHHV